MAKLGVGGKRRKSSLKEAKPHHLVKAVDADKMIEVAVKRATCQPGVTKQEGMTTSADKFLKDRTGMLQEEFFGKVSDRLEEIVSLLLDDLVEKHGQIPPQNLAYTFSTLMDKALLISGRPQALTAKLNVGLGATGLTRQDVVSALSGGKPEEKVVEEAKGDDLK